MDEIETIKSRIQAILEKLNWTEEGVLRDYNKTSTLESNSVEELTWLNVEPHLPESCTNKNSVILENKELQKLLNKPTVKAPEKFSDLQINFSREEKLLLYEHTVSQKKDFQFSVQPGNDLIADIVAIKKREKQKRRKFRISKPTQTEELRSLIDLQMQALQEFYESNQKTEICEDNKRRKFKPMNNLKSDKKTRQGERTLQNNKFQEEATTTERCFKGTYENKMSDKEHVSREKRHRKFSDNNSRSKEKHKSRSRSRRSSSNERRHRSRSRKRKKEKRKKSHRSSRHRSSYSPNSSSRKRKTYDSSSR